MTEPINRLREQMDQLRTLCLDEPATPEWTRITPDPETGTAYLDIGFGRDRILIDLDHAVNITDKRNGLDEQVIDSGSVLVSYEASADGLPHLKSTDVRYLYESHKRADDIGNETLVAEYILLANGYRQDTQQNAWHLNHSVAGVNEQYLLITGRPQN